ncbi:hypothetical protein [Chryseolinea soli]|uniref:Cthe-2314-like HEPN domain-containing protein n=1 Tax=Chryseolinea soli TaxID=2321403 RepID=A0A385SXK1_9BACT|nr:hypothetical protein [Chryseolinea soli]AYB34755.1 hypothetical protein D4L85_31080 [Chryseolinea soli]
MLNQNVMITPMYPQQQQFQLFASRIDRITQTAGPSLQFLQNNFGLGTNKTSGLAVPLAGFRDYVLNLTATIDTFFNPQFWQTRMPMAPINQIHTFQNHQITYLKFSFLFSIVSLIESEMRKMVRYFCNLTEAKPAFGNIYPAVLARFNLNGQYLETYKIARLIRNTVHNNGVHNDPSTTVTFSGTQYQFSNGQPIGFFAFAFNGDLLESLLNSMVAIVQSNLYQTSNY